jgi:hypothetical protein
MNVSGAVQFLWSKIQVQFPELESNFGSCYFNLPRLHFTSGASISIQCNHGNYMESTNGVRKFGRLTSVEWGFPSAPHWLFIDQADDPTNVCNNVGPYVNLIELDKLCAAWGEVDMRATLNELKTFEKPFNFVNINYLLS